MASINITVRNNNPPGGAALINEEDLNGSEGAEKAFLALKIITVAATSLALLGGALYLGSVALPLITDNGLPFVGKRVLTYLAGFTLMGTAAGLGLSSILAPMLGGRKSNMYQHTNQNLKDMSWFLAKNAVVAPTVAAIGAVAGITLGLHTFRGVLLITVLIVASVSAPFWIRAIK